MEIVELLRHQVSSDRSEVVQGECVCVEESETKQEKCFKEGQIVRGGGAL